MQFFCTVFSFSPVTYNRPQQFFNCRAAKEAGAPIAIINIGETRADDFVSLKINARCGEVRAL